MATSTLGDLSYTMSLNDKKFNDKLDALDKRLSDINKRFGNLTNITIGDINTADMKDAVALLDKINKSMNNMRGGGSKDNTAITGLKKQLSELEKQWASLTAAQRKGIEGEAIISQYRKLRDEAGVYSKTLNQLTKDNAQAANSNHRFAESMRASQIETKKQSLLMTELWTTLRTFAGFYFARDLAMQLANITGQFQLQKVALEALTQNAQEATKIFNQLQSLAVKSPFQFMDLTAYAKQLAAFQVPVKELYGTTKMLADLSAGLGVGMDRLILAYGQVKSASVLRGQELRQFTEAGIPLVQQLADKFSVLEGRMVSTGEVLDKYIPSRMVPFEMIRDIFEDMTGESGKFYNMQEKQSETLYGKISNLKDAYQIMMNSIGSANSGLLMTAVDIPRTIMENWEMVWGVLSKVGIAYGTFRAMSALVAASVGSEASAYIRSTEAMNAKQISALKLASSYRLLTAEESRLVASTKAMTGEQMAQAIVNKEITKDQVLRLASMGKLNLAQREGLMLSGQITAEELRYAQAVAMSKNEIFEKSIALRGQISQLEQLKKGQITQLDAGVSKEAARANVLALAQNGKLTKSYRDRAIALGLVTSAELANIQTISVWSKGVQYGTRKLTALSDRMLLFSQSANVANTSIGNMSRNLAGFGGAIVARAASGFATLGKVLGFVGAQIKAMTVALLASPLTWIMLGITAISAAWTNASEKAKMYKEMQESTLKNITDSFRDMQSAMRKFNDEYANMGEAMQSAKLKETLASFGTLGEYIAQNAKSLQELKDGYNDLLSSLETAKDYSNAFAMAQKGTDGWFDESIIDNANDLGDAIGRVSERAAALGIKASDIRKFANGIIASKQGSEEFRKEIQALLNSGADLSVILALINKEGIGLKDIINGDVSRERWDYFTISLSEANRQLNTFSDDYEQFIAYVKKFLPEIDFTQPLSRANALTIERLKSEWLEAQKELQPQMKQLLSEKIPLTFEYSFKVGDVKPELNRVTQEINKFIESFAKDSRFSSGFISDQALQKDISNFTEWAQELVKRKEQAKIELDYIQANPSMFTPEQLARAKDDFMLLEELVKKYFIETAKAASSKGGESALSKELNRQISLLKEAQAQYANLLKYQKKMDAQSTMQTIGEGRYKGLELGRDDYYNKLKQILKESDKLSKEEAAKIRDAIEKELAAIDTDRLKDKIEEALRKATQNIESYTTKFNLFDKILGITGDESLAIDLAFEVTGNAEDIGATMAQSIYDQIQMVMGDQELGLGVDMGSFTGDTSDLKAFNDYILKFKKAVNASDMSADTKKMLLGMTDSWEKYFAGLVVKYAENIAKYGTYSQKVAAISQGYQDQIKTAQQLGDTQLEQALASQMQMDIMKISSEYNLFFSGIESMTLQMANNIAEQMRIALSDSFSSGAISAKQYQQELKRIETQLDKIRYRKSDKMTYLTEGLDAMYKKQIEDANAAEMAGYEAKKKAQDDYNDALREEKKAQEDGNKAAEHMARIKQSIALSSMKAADSDIEGARAMGDAAVKGMQMANSMASGMTVGLNAANAVIKVADSFLEMMDSFGADTDTGVLGGIKDATMVLSTVSSSVSDAFNSLKSGDIFGAVASMVTLPMNLITAFNKKHDDQLERSIDKYKKLVKQLGYEYDKLGDKIEKTLSGNYKELYTAQLKNLNEQLAAQKDILKKEEEKKRTDKDSVQEYKNTIRDLEDQIAEFSQTVASELYGIDLKDWAAQLSDSITGALASGEDAVAAFKSTYADMIRDVVNNTLRMAILEPALNNLTEYLKDAMKDMHLSEDELVGIANRVDSIQGGVVGQYEDMWNKINEQLGGILTDTEDKAGKGYAEGIQAVTEDTASLIGGYMNGMRSEMVIHTTLMTNGNIIAQSQLNALNAQLAEVKAIRSALEGVIGIGRNGKALRTIID